MFPGLGDLRVFCTIYACWSVRRGIERLKFCRPRRRRDDAWVAKPEWRACLGSSYLGVDMGRSAESTHPRSRKCAAYYYSEPPGLNPYCARAAAGDPWLRIPLARCGYRAGFLVSQPRVSPFDRILIDIEGRLCKASVRMGATQLAAMLENAGFIPITNRMVSGGEVPVGLAPSCDSPLRGKVPDVTFTSRGLVPGTDCRG
jgi:hypothetical protein